MNITLKCLYCLNEDLICADDAFNHEGATGEPKDSDIFTCSKCQKTMTFNQLVSNATECLCKYIEKTTGEKVTRG